MLTKLGLTPKSKFKAMDKVGESAQKKTKTVLSAGEVLLTVFWHNQGIILIDYFKKGKTITGSDHAN